MCIQNLPNYIDWETLTTAAEEHIVKSAAEIKKQAAYYLKQNCSKKLGRSEIKALVTKTDKIKNHNKKNNRHQRQKLSKLIIQAYNATIT